MSRKTLLNLVRIEPLAEKSRVHGIVTSLSSEANADPNIQKQGANSRFEKCSSLDGFVLSFFS